MLDGLDEPLLDRAHRIGSAGEGRRERRAVVEEAWLNDQSLLALLLTLADGNHSSGHRSNGLCVITSRMRIRELCVSQEGTAKEIRLSGLNEKESARVLLHRCPGLRTHPQELVERAGSRLAGHPESLVLLGTYLSRQSDETRQELLNQLVKERGDGQHGPSWFLPIYERWLVESLPRVQALRLLALFVRPAKSSLVDAIREQSIPGITDELIELSPDQWQEILGELTKLNLLRVGKPDVPQLPDSETRLDIPSKVREYFARSVQVEFPESWGRGQRLLYESYSKQKDAPPGSHEEMVQLCVAACHGCRARSGC